MPVTYLGFIYHSLNDASTTKNYLESRIGGAAVWLTEYPPPDISFLCSDCNKPLFLLCQLYTSYNDTFHRVLYVFCCSNCSSCFSSPNRWLVLRGQIRKTNSLVTASVVEAPNKNLTNFSNSILEGAEFSFLGIKKLVEGPQKNNFGQKFHNNSESSFSSEVGTDWMASAFGGGTRDPAEKHYPVTTNENYPQIPLGALRSESSSATSSTFNIDTHFKSPDNLLQLEICRQKALLSNFPPFSITINEEFDDTEDPNDYLACKTLELLERYKQREDEGSIKQEDQEDERSISGNGKWQNEVYEKNPHEVFLKLQRKIMKHPHQIIRYSFGGSPLWFKQIPQQLISLIPACENCGSKRVFEMQILPTLPFEVVSRIEGKIPPIPCLQPTYNWGTLALYSCARDCVSTTSAYLREVVILQEE